MHALEMAEDLAAQIEHHLLPGPLHEVDLCELQEEDRDLDAEKDPGDLRNAGEGFGTQEAIEEAVRRTLNEVFVDRRFRQVGTEHVHGGLHHDGDYSKHHLPAVSAQIGQQPFHQTAVICFS
jgi:hypothetical protein